MDPINPDKTVSEIETDDVTMSAPDSPPASGANNDANLQGQQQQPQPQQAQGPGQKLKRMMSQGGIFSFKVVFIYEIFKIGHFSSIPPGNVENLHLEILFHTC